MLADYCWNLTEGGVYYQLKRMTYTEVLNMSKINEINLLQNKNFVYQVGSLLR